MGGEGNAVLAVGAIMVDLVCRVPRLPVSGEGIVVEESHAAVGGCAFNAANAVRQLGVPCELFAPVGSGIFAGFVERELCERGLSAPYFSERDSGGCVCFVEPGGERTMVTLPGIEQCFAPEWFAQLEASARSVSQAAVDGDVGGAAQAAACSDVGGAAQVVAGRFACGFASGYEIEGPGGDAIIDFFEAHPAIQFYYAPGPRICGVGDAKTARINALRPVWHLNDQEALAYTGCATLEKAGAAIAEICGNAVVVTAGADGAHLFDGPGDRHVVVPAQQVQVADTIGAGDAHLGALAAARAAGRSWEDALVLANRFAGAVCAVRGATLSDEAFALTGIRL